MENLNLNIDAKTLEQCLKSVTHFGSTEYINICTEKISVVPWGGADWLGGIGVCLLAAFVIGMVGSFAIRIIFDN